MNRKLLGLVRKLEKTSTFEEACEELWEMADEYEKEIAEGTASFSENELIHIRDIPLLVEKISKDGMRITLKVTHPDDIADHEVSGLSE